MKLEDQLERDRALKEAAWEAVSHGVDWLQADLDHRSIPARLTRHLGAKARDAASKSGKAAQRNALALAAVAAAAGLWFARRPLKSAALELWQRTKEKHAARRNEAE